MQSANLATSISIQSHKCCNSQNYVLPLVRLSEARALRIENDDLWAKGEATKVKKESIRLAAVIGIADAIIVFCSTTWIFWIKSCKS